MKNLDMEAIKNLPYLCFRNKIAIDANQSFAMMCGYEIEELLGKDMTFILSEMLRLNKKIWEMELPNVVESCFLFTKLQDFKEIRIDIIRSEELTVLIFKQLPLISIKNPLSYTYQLISDNIMGIALYSAEDTTLLKASKEYEKNIHLKYGVTDIIGKKIYEFHIGWLEGPQRNHWNIVLETGKSYYEKEFKSTNSITGKVEYYDVNISPILDENRVKFIVVTLSNVTDRVIFRKQNEEKAILLQKQKEQLELILDNMNDGIIIIDKNDQFVYQNKAVVSYFNIKLDELGDAFREAKYFDVDGKVLAMEEMPAVLIKKGQHVIDRVMLIKIADKETYVSVSGTPIFDSEGNYEMGVLAIRDITEHVRHQNTIREQQQVLLQIEKNEKENLEKIIEMKDEFLSLISHEFKTPLTVINSALQAIELICKEDLTDKLRNYLGKIKQNTYRQIRLVNNLLDITKANVAQLKLYKQNHDIVFLTGSIIESVNLYAKQKQISIDFQTDFVEKIIALDEEKYERILLNLLSNAIKYSPSDKKIYVKLSETEEKVILAVEDQGVGIPEEKQRAIFERFGQVEDTYIRQAEGTGIGLYLVKLLVESLGGTISLMSRPGAGSTFTVELPNILHEIERETAVMKELIDTRLVQSIAIELSDIYF